ncbi:MAG: hypothetical protein KDA25_10900 [Phycisphaerales bacterium]|nr:hypothetical protein [Phycisphaerales bacterium]
MRSTHLTVTAVLVLLGTSATRAGTPPDADPRRDATDPVLVDLLLGAVTATDAECDAARRALAARADDLVTRASALVHAYAAVGFAPELVTADTPFLNEQFAWFRTHHPEIGWDDPLTVTRTLLDQWNPAAADRQADAGARRRARRNPHDVAARLLDITPDPRARRPPDVPAMREGGSWIISMYPETAAARRIAVLDGLPTFIAEEPTRIINLGRFADPRFDTDPHLEPDDAPQRLGAYLAMRDVWSAVVVANPDRPDLLRQAAAFCALNHRPRDAESFLMRGCIASADRRPWLIDLGELFEVRLFESSSAWERAEHAVRSYGYYGAALMLVEREQKDARIELVHRLSMVALEAGDIDGAIRYANELIAYEDHYMNTARHRHRGHSVLGRVALAAGDVDAAADHLLKSAFILDTPDFAAAGPSMILAVELLEAGEVDAVRQYLNNLGRPWQADGLDALRRWKDELTRHEIPSIDRFLRH